MTFPNLNYSCLHKCNGGDLFSSWEKHGCHSDSLSLQSAQCSPPIPCQQEDMAVISMAIRGTELHQLEPSWLRTWNLKLCDN